MNDVAVKLGDLRQKVLDGENISVEEYKDVLDALRSTRTPSVAPKKKTPSTTDRKLRLEELDNLISDDFS